MIDKSSRPRAWWQFWRRREEAVDPELLRRIFISLGMVPKRRHSRLAVEERSQVQVLIGLSQISKTVADEKGLILNAADAGPNFTSRDVKTAERQEDDVWDLIFPAELPKKQIRPALPPRPQGKRQEAAGDGPNWRLLNISAGGYCLLSDPAQTARAQVGELIALRELDDRQSVDWRIGLIRWMKYVPGEGLQLGVQVLAANPAPVLVQPQQEDGGFGSQARGLMLPQSAAAEQPATLLAPCLAGYVEERRLRVSGHGSDSEVVLTRQLEATGAFTQFEFRSGAAVAPERTELDSIFSSI